METVLFVLNASGGNCYGNHYCNLPHSNSSCYQSNISCYHINCPSLRACPCNVKK